MLFIRNLEPRIMSGRKRQYALYSCPDCKIEVEMRTDSKAKKCFSCSQKTHGDRKERLYAIWSKMRGRCTNTNNPAYKYYGGKGVVVCEEWNNYSNFKEWAIANGYSKELSIDRVDSDGNYEPDNCRWVNDTIQARNRKKPHTNKSGYVGVCKAQYKDGWQAYIMVDRKQIMLGVHKTAELAHQARVNHIEENKLEGFNHV